MNTLNTTVNIITLVYGAILILATFKSNKITETFRLDALFMPRPTQSTRMINLPAGMLAVGYTLYTMLK